MGGKDWHDDEIVIVDEMFTSAATDARHHLHIERIVLTPRIGGEAYVLWGMTPADETNVSFARGTICLTSREVRDSGSLIETLVRRQFHETIDPDRDRSFQFSTHHTLDDAGGVYHALLPPYFLPTSMSEAETTKLINVKKTDRSQMALTWLFDRTLGVHLRIAEASSKAFWSMPADGLLQAKKPASRVGSITADAMTLVKNPEAWKVLMDAIRLAVGREPG